jgi:hypothetical protein
MTNFEQHRAAERAMRELLPGAGLPPPDEVEYEETSVVMLWHETKLAVVIDLDDPPPAAAAPQPSRSSPRERSRT